MCAPTSRSVPTDDELDAEITRLAEQLEEKPAKVRKDLERRGVLEAVRSDIARGKAVTFLVDHATVVDEDGNTVDISLPEPAPAAPAADDEVAEADEEAEAVEAAAEEEPEA